jgi:hypothetical protein
MKKALSTFIFTSIIIIANAQSPLPVGKNQLNIGLGLSGWGIPVYIGIDHSVSRDITLGGELSFRSYKENYRNYDYNHHITGISVNGNYHFNRLLTIPQNFDFYAGLNLGFYIWSSPSDYNGSHTSGLDLNAQIGGRYYFSKNAGINLEFGGGNAFSGGKFGLSFKL